MDVVTLLASMEFARARLLKSLEGIEASGQPLAQVLGWRPGPGRAHIAWQAMHCAATHDKYLNVAIHGRESHDAALVAHYGGGTTPSDESIPDLAAIRTALAGPYAALREYVARLKGDEFSRKLPSGRTIGESILLLIWHETHHQGQIHLTWNLYRQAHGI